MDRKNIKNEIKHSERPDHSEHSENTKHSEPTREELRQQTMKWLAKLEKELKDIKAKDSGKLPKGQYKSMTENMLAYVKDSRHFIEKDDWVRAFEAVIYAWGIYETCLRAGIMKRV